MAAKLSRLPLATQKALGQLACLGNLAETATLTLVHGGSEEEIHASLWEAVRAGLVRRADTTYAFLHDRIQEAAYALIPQGERVMAHLRIGRLLAARTTAGGARREDLRHRESVRPRRGADHRGGGARAGRRAQPDGGQARQGGNRLCLGPAIFHRRPRCWRRTDGNGCYRLAFDLELNRAECEYLTGELASAEKRLAALSDRAADHRRLRRRHLRAHQPLYESGPERQRRRGGPGISPASSTAHGRCRRRRRMSSANMTGCGSGWGPTRSRRCSICR